jgi:hypothetical protein
LSLSRAPKIDPRNANDVAQQLEELLKVYAPAWRGVPKGASAALIGVSARFAEVIIQRLNQVPQKNFLSFLQLLGAGLLPPLPARAPVTFLLAKGSLVDAVVPVGTQVAAPPSPGENDPVIYETENELVATSAELALAFVRDPEEDTYADYSDDIIATGSSGTPVFHGNQQIGHILYLGQSQFLNSPDISSLRLVVDLESPAGDDIALIWEIWNGAKWQDMTPALASDATNGLKNPGTIAFGGIPAAQISSVGQVSKEWIRGRLLTPITLSSDPRSGMIRAGRLPIVRSIGMSAHLHNDGLLIDEAYSTATGLIDLSKDFYPFGEKPKFNDTLWLAMEEAFSNAGATVTLNLTVTNQPGSDVQVPKVAAPSDDLKLRWEVWNGAWIELGTSTNKGPAATIVNGRAFSDTTNAFSQSGKVGFVLPAHVASFSVNGKESSWVRVRIVSGDYGVEGHFVAKKSVPEPPAPPFDFVLPTFQPPSISSLTAAYDLDKPQVLPEAVLAENDFVITDFTARNGASGQTFAPFQPSLDPRPTVYLGFVLPTGRTTFPNNTITMFFHAADLQYGQKTIPLAPDVSRGAADPSASISHKFVVANPGQSVITYVVNVMGSQWDPAVAVLNSDGSLGSASPTSVELAPGGWAEIDVQLTVPPGLSFGASDSGILQLVSRDRLLHTAEFVTFAFEEANQTEQLQITWEYWSGQKWSTLVVRDDTSNLTTTGTVEFLAPPDFAAHGEFGATAWWLRVRWDAGDYDTDPRIRRVFLNTTMAAQTVTVRNEVLGSSDGSASQSFQTTRVPVLPSQSLAVREAEMPSGDELQTIIEDEGVNAVVPDSTVASTDTWVTWHEMPDFYSSLARSRHYVLDHITGAVSFGDGLYGMIPPAGSSNIRLSLYQTGGGVRGNRPAASIIQIKTTVPYIDKVTNYVDATGGANAESMDSLISRAPMEIRHRHRAVTAEDYEDLVHLSSPDIARVRCVPIRDLVANPFDNTPILGSVSLIIVPDTTDAQPQPSIELVRRVQSFISASSPVTATVFVVGPHYLRIDVQTEVGLASLDGAGTVAPKVQNALAAFLHPLTGGPDGKGWEFGREPHRSDIYRVIEEIPGVDHVRALTVQSTEDFPGSRETGRFLVYSGTHSVALVFEP